MSMAISNNPLESKNVSRRWPKRLLLWGVIAVVLALSFSALRPKRRLLLAAAGTESANRAQEPLVRSVDQAMNRVIQKADLQPTMLADWSTICRRLNMSLVGSSLSLEDVRRLETHPEKDRSQIWLEHLLADSRMADYLSERLTRAFVGTNNGPFLLFRRRKFQLWLAEHLRRNTPYDQVVREMIAAQGLWTDKPEVNFLTATMDENDNGRADPIRMAGRTSRAFLGMRIDCLQCHSDFLDKMKFGSPEEPHEGTQQHFHQLAAFYAGARVAQGNVFAGLRDDQQEYRYKYLDDEEETTVLPCVPFDQHLMPSHGSPRQRLAAWVTHPDNRVFTRATVNRVWAILFGRPMLEPVDDLPLHGPFPAGLEILAEGFAKHDYDLRWLIRTITQLEAFQRDSKSLTFPVTAEHEKCWAVFPLTQLRPEQVAASIHQACRLKTIDERSTFIAELEKFGYVNDFLKGYGDRGEDEFVAQSVTVPQRLLVMNGNLVNERTGQNPIANASTRIAQLARQDEQAINIAYLATLNRSPESTEMEAFKPMIEGKRGDERALAMTDLYWILVNSTEFLWNH